MAVIQVTTVTTLNPSPDRRKLLGKTRNGTGNCPNHCPRRLERTFRTVGVRSEFNPAGVLEGGRKWEQAFGPSAMSEYQKTAQEEQVALSNWTRGRAEIHESIRKGRDTSNELRTLQASFANAWALLQFHEHDWQSVRSDSPS